MEDVLAAKDYFLQHGSPKVVNLRIALSFGSKRVTFQSVSDMAGFDASAFVSNAIDASMDGELQTPLQGFLNDFISSALGDENRSSSWCLRKGSNHYAITTLYQAPEVLLDDYSAGHGDAELIALPKYFPFDTGANDEVAALRSMMRGESVYYAVCDDPQTREQNLKQANALCEAACLLEKNNPLFATRLAAVLCKLGKKKEAIELLKTLHKDMPHVAKLYFRIGMQLFDEGKYKSALVTVHGGAKYMVLRTRLGGKLLTLARRCLVQIFGARALGAGSASALGSGVLHMILDSLNIWEVLRVSEVCFAWWSFTNMEAYWKRRIQRDFTEKQIAATFHGGKTRETYRKMFVKIAEKLDVQGYATYEWALPLNNKGFYRFPAQFADEARFVWKAWLTYLRRLGYKPENLGFFVPMSSLECRTADHTGRYPYMTVWTIAATVLRTDDRRIQDGAIFIVPASGAWPDGMTYCAGCSFFTTRLGEPECARYHPKYATNTKYALERIEAGKDEASKEAAHKIRRDIEVAEKRAMGRYQPVYDVLHLCCGARQGLAGCARYAHKEGYHYVITKHVVTAFPKKAVVDVELKPLMIPKSSPLRDDDYKVLPFEQMAFQQHGGAKDHYEDGGHSDNKNNKKW